MRRLVPILPLLVLAGSCGGTAPQPVRLTFDTVALADLGIVSLQVQPYGPQDANGGATQCDGLLQNFLDPADYVPVGAVQVVEVGGEPSVTVTIPDLPPGLVFVLAVGYDQPGAGGQAVAAGCGTGAIRKGEKTVIVIAMESTS